MNQSMIIATIVGETQKDTPTLINASLNGKELRHSTNKNSVLIYIDEPIGRNDQPKVSMNFEEGSNLGLEISVFKGENK